METAGIWNQLGNTYYQTGSLDKAADAYQKAIDQGSNSGWLLSNLATIYIKKQRYNDAVPLLMKCLEVFSDPNDLASTWGNLGTTYRQLNEHGKAIQAFQKADEIMPTRTGSKDLVLNRIGLTNQRKNEFVESQAGEWEWNRSSSAGSETTEVDGFHFSGDNAELTLDSAKNQVATLPAEKGKDAHVWNELGLVLFKVGAYDDAIDAYQKAIAYEPKLGYIYSNLAQVYVVQGKLAEAIELYEASLNLLTNDKEKAVSWSRLGDIYRQMGNTEQAEASYNLADALNWAQSANQNEYCRLKLDQIVSSADETRKKEDIEELSMSIRLHGMIEPLVVCPGRNMPGKYMLISGGRRLEAARRLGLTEVPVLVRQASSQEMLELSINSNIHSLAVNPLELANQYRCLANEFDLSIEEIAERVGRTCHSIANAMQISDAPVGIKAAAEVTAPALSENQPTPAVNPQPAVEMDPQPEVEPAAVFADAPEPEAVQAQADAETKQLWYMAAEDQAATGEPEVKSSKKMSLLERARQMLSCNPHFTRNWISSSSR